MKIVVIGGGSYVFAPAVLEDAIIKYGLSGSELALVDINRPAADAMAGAGKRMAQDAGISMKIWATDDRREALQDADFVITSAAYQGAKRWKMDYEICREEGIPNQARETGGLGGISYSFRSITLLLSICRDMEKICPKAILLNVSNPLTKVHTAIHRFTDIKAYGFCNVAWGGATGYEWLSRLIERPMEGIEVITGGLNHFSWFIKVNDKNTGEDLMPLVIQKIMTGDDRELKVRRDWYERYGGIAAPPVDHHGEFLPDHPDIHYITTPPFHGNQEERIERMKNLERIASGEISYKDAPKFAGSSWEHPVQLATAIHRRENICLDMLNLPNDGYIPQLPHGNIVEIPVKVLNGKVEGYKGLILPEKVAQVCNNQSQVNELAARAAVYGDRKIAREAVETDMVIEDKKAALSALDKMLTVHADILSQFK